MVLSIILGILGIIAGLIITLPFWPPFLAKHDKFLTYVKEGEAKIVVVGESYVQTLLSLNGHVVGDDEYIIAANQEKGFLREWFGVYFMGINPYRKIHTYGLRWVAYQPKADGSGGKEPVTKNAVALSSTFVKDKVYYGKASGVETKEGLPLTVEFLVTLKVVSPYKAIFLISNWVEAAIDRTTQQVRVYIGTKGYRELVEKETSKPIEGFSGYIAEALGEVFRKDYGIQFVSCDILSIDPPESYREITTTAYTAEQNATAVTTKAKADATAIKAKGDAEAHVIKEKGLAEALSLEIRIEAAQKNPKASEILLTTEAAKALSVANLAEAIGKGLGWNKEGVD